MRPTITRSPETRRGPAPPELSGRWVATLLALIVLVGAGLRLWGLGAWPPGLYQDEAFNGLDALGVLAGDTPLYFPANNGREPAYIYLTSLSVAALGRSPLAVRLPAAVAGVLLIPATYALGTALYGRRVGLWAAAVLAVTFWPVALSRIGLRAGLLPLVVALSLACVARGLRAAARRPDDVPEIARATPSYGSQAGRLDRGGLAWLALGGALYGLSFYTYLASRFTPLALLGILVFWYSAQRSRFPKPRQIAAFLLAAGLAALPLGLAGLAQPEILVGRVGQVSVLNPAINGGDLVGTLFHNLLAALGMFNWRGDDIARHNLPARPVFDAALGLAFGVGAFIAGRAAVGRRSLAHALPLIWMAVMVLPTILAEDTPHFLRAVGVLPMAALLPALALDALWGFGSSLAVRWAARALATAAVAIGLALTARDYFDRYVHADDTGYLFQSAATELAVTANVYLAEDAARQVRLDRRLWDSFAPVRFLLAPDDRLRLYADSELAPVAAPALMLAWPYEDLQALAAALPVGGVIAPSEGPLYRGDLEPAPYALYAAYRLEPCTPAACPTAPLAEFEGGLRLLRADTRPLAGGLAVELTWQASAPGDAVQVAALAHGQDAEGAETLLAQADGPLGTAFYPREWWRAGEIVRETRWFWWRGKGAQPVVVRIGLYDPVTGARLARADSESDFVEIVGRSQE
jgi:4-amino-4-deoxy-L-arabinose transferase-like glycosyltransferase